MSKNIKISSPFRAGGIKQPIISSQRWKPEMIFLTPVFRGRAQGFWNLSGNSKIQVFFLFFGGHWTQIINFFKNFDPKI
jgi:hypothetical protein